jgi:hypothetical protein
VLHPDMRLHVLSQHKWETTQSATSKRQTIPASEVPPTSAGLHAADGLSVIAEFWEPSKVITHLYFRVYVPD